MKITYNGTTYNLTTAQLNGLRDAAMMPSGAFSMDRRNDATDSKLETMGLLEEDFAYRDPEERRVKRDSVILDLQRALDHLRADLSWVPEGDTRVDAAELRNTYDTKAEEVAGSAARELQAMMRTRHYLTEAAYGIVLQQFPMGVVFVPAKYAHLTANIPMHNATQEVK
jgi:hypothetical protein